MLLYSIVTLDNFDNVEVSIIIDIAFIAIIIDITDFIKY